MLEINIIFAKEADGPTLNFVEIENDKGQAINIGSWFPDPARKDQYTLKITAKEIEGHYGIIKDLPRCVICGAKNETHDQDHSCRMHRDSSGLCTVCNSPYKFCVRAYKKTKCVGTLPGPGGCAVDCPGNHYF